ncbi:hypothetical protein NDN08_000612 [Rhodosorus marinus]|uniref:gamma-glutamylcyclotransferase n=1 Tax=Rhodosorus marinus TaxID=101924 RepID=A0AAV8UNL7_9RHOD|nr:hypothetical protein NDN08_000612 [Rhodosorus marinus]
MNSADEDRFLYFSFGSNLNKNRLQINCPSAKLISSGSLDGYELDFTLHTERWGGAAADIRVHERGTVHGAIWSIRTDQLDKLDVQEGVSIGHYYRLEIGVKTPSGDQINCYTYKVLNPQSGLVPSALYMRVIIQGAIDVQLPHEYIEALRSVATNSYDDDRRYQKALEGRGTF